MGRKIHPIGFRLKINRDWQAYLAAVIRKHGRKALTEPPRVILSTIHGVKGEEADHVCILSAMSAKTAESYLTDPEEERRVFYVGVTRAQRRLTFCLPLARRKWGKLRPTRPSRFLYELTGQADNPNYLAAKRQKPPRKGKGGGGQ